MSITAIEKNKNIPSGLIIVVIPARKKEQKISFLELLRKRNIVLIKNKINNE